MGMTEPVCCTYWRVWELGLVMGLVGAIGVTPTRLQFPLVYLRVKCAVGWLGLGHSIYWFA